MFRILITLTLIFIFAACSKKGAADSVASPSETIPSGNSNIAISWTANREADVNTTGGGYRVYYSLNANVNTAVANYIDVPYASGPTAPTSAQITGVAAGTYYIRVIAYSAYNPYAVATGNRSADSSEAIVTVN